MAAKRETSVLDDRARPATPLAGDDDRPPVLDLGISGVEDFELLAVGPTTNRYRAHQPALQRDVEVTVLQTDPGGPDGEAFDRERATAGRLTGHSGIVPLLDAGITTAGRPFLVYPHYRRGSMARLVAEHGPLGWREASFLVEGVSVTMCELHGRGLVHGGLGPEAVRLTDFLLPRVGDLSTCGPIGATAPAATGAGATTAATDVAALGRLLRFLLTGSAKGDLDDVPDPVRDVIDGAARTLDGGPVDAAAFVVALRSAVARIEGRSVDTPATIGPAPTIVPATGTAAGANGTSDDRLAAVGADQPSINGSHSVNGTGSTPRSSRHPAGRSLGDDGPLHADEALALLQWRDDDHEFDDGDGDSRRSDLVENTLDPGESDDDGQPAADATKLDDIVLSSDAGAETADRPDAPAVDGPGREQTTATASVEARYILGLVACIAVAVLVMVLAAVLAVS